MIFEKRHFWIELDLGHICLGVSNQIRPEFTMSCCAHYPESSSEVVIVRPASCQCIAGVHASYAEAPYSPRLMGVVRVISRLFNLIGRLNSVCVLLDICCS
jgi:hypothetical protein